MDFIRCKIIMKDVDYNSGLEMALINNGMNQWKISNSNFKWKLSWNYLRNLQWIIVANITWSWACTARDTLTHKGRWQGIKYYEFSNFVITFTYHMWSLLVTDIIECVG